jgi:hypothetical protein
MVSSKTNDATLAFVEETSVSTMTTEEYREYQSKMELTRWVETHNKPAEMYWPVFAPMPSKRKGDLWESAYKDKCASLSERLDQWHDASLKSFLVEDKSLKGSKVEIKYTAITTPDSNSAIAERGFALELGQRAKTIDINNPRKQQGGGSFQQVHPENADYGLFTAVHGNGAVHYWLPYHLISKNAGKKNKEEGKVPLSSMHHGATVEGQINLTARFHELFFLDVTIGTPFITDLSKYDFSKYENLVF